MNSFDDDSRLIECLHSILKEENYNQDLQEGKNKKIMSEQLLKDCIFSYLFVAKNQLRKMGDSCSTASD